jgi:hypothetical protein
MGGLFHRWRDEGRGPGTASAAAIFGEEIAEMLSLRLSRAGEGARSHTVRGGPKQNSVELEPVEIAETRRAAGRGFKDYVEIVNAGG